MAGAGESCAVTLIVDDHPAYRAGLRVLLAQEVGIAAVSEAGSVAAARDCLAARRYDLVIVDVVLPDTGGIALVRELVATETPTKILVLSLIDERVRIAEMLRAGATGYAFKTQPPSEILDAVQHVRAGQRYLPPGLPAVEAFLAETSLPLERLTARERSVFDLLVKGLRNQSVADQLAIARRTIDAHRRHIMQKLGARSVVDLIRIAMRHGSLGDR